MMNKKWVVIILSLALIMLIMPQNITAEDNSVNYDNLIIVSDDIVSEDGSNVVRWTKDKTYVICSKNIVNRPTVKCKLIIEPGTTILFGTGTGNIDGIENSEVVYRPYPIFIVEEDGGIEAKGTKDEPITFKNIDTHMGWNGIEIILPDTGEVTDTFEYCNFINGGAQYRDFTEGLIDVSYGTEETKFNLVVEHCNFDSTELVKKVDLQASEIGAGVYYGDHEGNKVEANIKISNSTFKSLSMGIEGVTSDEYDSYLYNEKSNCVIENNVFENNVLQSYNPSVVWGGNAEIKDNVFYTKEGGALTKNALDLHGQCNYVIEGNTFYGSQSTESGMMNKCAPVKVQFGANINADKTRNYKENICDYSSEYGNYVELNGSMITKECNLGKVPGLEYYFKNCSIGYKNGNKSKVKFEAGSTNVIESLDVLYNGELDAMGEKANPVRFVAASDRGLTTASNGISINQNSSSDYLEGKAVFENCVFDNVKLSSTVVSKSTESKEKIPQVLTIKNSDFINESSGISVKFNSYYDYICGKILIENVSVKGMGNDTYSGMSITAYGNKIPAENIFKASNCVICNFQQQRYGIGLDLSIDDNLTDRIVLENMTLANNYYGVKASKSMTKLPIIQDSIIAKNTRGFDVSEDINTSNITYTCIYNDGWDGNTYGYGEGCIFKDPLFADLDNRDFHLKSTGGRWDGTKWITDTVTSPCINAGNPASDYLNELSPNGNRVNMGAFGNTSQASKTGDGSVPPTTNPAGEETTTPGATNPSGETTTPGATNPNVKPTTSGTASTGSTTTQGKETLIKPSVKKIKKGSKKLTVTLNKTKNSGKVFYEIQYSTKKNFKKATKTLKVSAKKTKVIIKKLRGNKKYYVRIRAYQTKKVNDKNKKVYSAWTKVKMVKTKK
ncbi:fibronectin type III domain-containing protein [uncultured Eubacterium sp.]|uniref:fibronectin type III domain-containing protein n=1 Tax=uncultured Eubacterium sp. TaxID=165185 RepID=UPI0025920EE1|nr:fibronectin type III domain-containing protein [uncultured Eubacterium sp.]